MDFDTSKVKDYITTGALALVPVLISYQSQIGQYVPVEYALLFTIAMGVISQLVTNERVRLAYEDTSVAVDQGQVEVQKYIDQIESLQSQIDEKQLEIDESPAMK